MAERVLGLQKHRYKPCVERTRPRRPAKRPSDSRTSDRVGAATLLPPSAEGDHEAAYDGLAHTLRTRDRLEQRMQALRARAQTASSNALTPGEVEAEEREHKRRRLQAEQEEALLAERATRADWAFAPDTAQDVAEPDNVAAQAALHPTDTDVEAECLVAETLWAAGGSLSIKDLVHALRTSGLSKERVAAATRRTCTVDAARRVHLNGS